MRNDVDKREGSIIFDAIAPVALELSQAYQALSMIVDESFADTASYQYLAKRAAERGLFPFESTHAIIKARKLPKAVTNLPIKNMYISFLRFVISTTFPIFSFSSLNIAMPIISVITSGSFGLLVSLYFYLFPASMP